MSSNIEWVSREDLMSAGIKHIQKDVDVLLDIGTGIEARDYVTPFL